jgi:hypothetical protein
MPQLYSTTELRVALDRWTQILPKLLGGISAALVAAATLRLLYIKYLPYPSEYLNQIFQRFTLGDELTFIAWFSSCMLTLCSAMSAIIATISSQQKGPDTWRWWVASALLIAMSADETVAIHEMLGVPIRTLYNFDGFLHHDWVVAATPFLVVIFITLGPILIRLPRMLSQRLTFAAIVYFGGAVGIEMVSGKIRELFPEGGIVPFICGTLEESMELTGLVLAISALMRCLQWILSTRTKAKLTQT